MENIGLIRNIYKKRIKYIDHVGSTSIKGIKSKPIIDINIQTDDLNDFKKYTESTVEREIYTVKKELTLGGDYLIRKEEYNKYKDNTINPWNNIEEEEGYGSKQSKKYILHCTK